MEALRGHYSIYVPIGDHVNVWFSIGYSQTDDPGAIATSTAKFSSTPTISFSRKFTL